MRGEHRASVVLVVCLLMATACGNGRSPSNNEGVPAEDPDAAAARRAVLANLGENVVLATYREFADAATRLQDATGAWSEAPSDDDALETAREAFGEAMTVWQRAELMQLGPAGAMGSVTGGEDLRDRIYSWPIVNACRVDQELVDGGYEDPQAFAGGPVNVRGLDALEYLLFHPHEENACEPNSRINSDGSWDALTSEEVFARRAAYATTVATVLADDARALRDAWDPEKGDFLAALAEAGAGNGTYGTTQEALNAVSDAMYYLETDVKDMKIADPVGLSGKCSETTCPDELESQWAERSLDNIEANLIAFRQLYTGGDGDGFDELLQNLGATEFDAQMSAALDDAITHVQGVEGSLRELLDDDPEAAAALFDAIKSVTDLLKTQFIGLLDLEEPQRAEGDND